MLELSLRKLRGFLSFRSVLLAVVVVAIVVLFVVVRPRARSLEESLTGFWTGETAFLREAGLSEAFLYIAPPESSGLLGLSPSVVRQGYLVMSSAAAGRGEQTGNLLSNQGIEISYSGIGKRWWSALRAHFGAPYEITGVRLSFDVSDVMPTSLCLSLDQAKGTLTLFDSEKVFAFFVRDNETSLSANAAFQAGADADANADADAGAGATQPRSDAELI